MHCSKEDLNDHLSALSGKDSTIVKLGALAV
jgi:hypothetical protein